MLLGVDPGALDWNVGDVDSDFYLGGVFGVRAQKLGPVWRFLGSLLIYAPKIKI